MSDSASSTIRHSVVIPAYNERQRLPDYLDEWVAHFERRGEPWEVIIVDDGSTDGTVEYVRERRLRTPSIKLLRNGKNCGKGLSVRRGMLRARGQIRLFADADGATPVSEHEKLLRYFDPVRIPIVIAARIPLRHFTRVERDMRRHYTGRVFATLVCQISGLTFYDTQCGFKMFSADAVNAIFPRVQCTRWAFDVEVLMLAEKLGFEVAEVPVNWREIPGSKVNFRKHAPQMFMDIVRMRMRHGVAGRKE